MEVIAEVGLAHDGSLGMAHAYIDALAHAGADVVKFQCHLGDQTTEWRVQPDWGNETRQEYWQRTGFNLDEWMGLADHCEAEGVEFLCSPFSAQAVQMINPLVRRWKVPSGRIADKALLRAVADTGKPVIVSSGMATLLEVNDAIRLLMDAGRKTFLLACTSMYPCPPEFTNLDRARQWDGLSDHSGTIFPGLACAALGCKILEVHVTLSRDGWGLDNAASITVEELEELVKGVRFIEQAMRPVDKDALAERLADTRRIFMHA